MKRLAFVLIAALLTGCGATSVEQQTLAAHEAAMNTALNDIHATGTVEHERIQVTAEYAAERVAAVGTQRGLMLSTLEARGLIINDLPAPVTATPSQNQPVPTQNEGTTFDSSIAPTPPPPTRDPNASPTPVQITPFSTATNTPRPTPQITIESTETNATLREIAFASGVDAEDCATNPTTQFSPQTTEIYIVARAVDMPADTTVTTTWFRENQPLETSFEVTYGYIEDACIWFFADQTNFDFTPGTYQVAVDYNGEPFGEYTFQITGEGGAAETTAEVTP